MYTDYKVDIKGRSYEEQKLKTQVDFCVVVEILTVTFSTEKSNLSEYTAHFEFTKSSQLNPFLQKN